MFKNTEKSKKIENAPLMVGDAWNTSKIYWNEFRKPIWVVSIVQKHGKSVFPRACQRQCQRMARGAVRVRGRVKGLSGHAMVPVCGGSLASLDTMCMQT